MSTKNLHPNRQLSKEILVQILCRLPVKPLIRFSSVSKRWHSLVFSNTQFAQSHFKLASDRKTLTQRLLISTDNQLRSLDAADNSWSLKNHTLFLNSNLLGSCNGLLIVDVVDCETHNLCLWNLSTKFVCQLPNPDFVFEGESEYAKYGFGHGLGYVSSINDYKFFIAGFVSSGVNNKWVVEMFSSKLNSWKSIQFSSLSSSFFISPDIGLGFLTNEALYWVPPYIEDLEEAQELTICAFDLAKGEFKEVPCLIFNADGDDVKGMGVKVVSRGGGECLCFSFTRGRDIEFWVMREYGVCESWNVLFIFNKNVLYEFLGGKLSGRDPVFITEGGTIIFKLRWERDMLLRIECHNEGKLVCSSPLDITDGDRWIYDVIEYDETLLLVPN